MSVTMPRLFVIFRTYDRIWTCKTLTREMAPFEMDTSTGPIKFLFTVDQVLPEAVSGDISQVGFCNNENICTKLQQCSYYHPHERLWPSVIHHRDVESEVLKSKERHNVLPSLLKRFTLAASRVCPENDTLSTGDFDENATEYFVLPAMRCTLLLDAHTASCLNCEYSRSKVFRRRFMRYLRRADGFRNCIPDYQKWTQEEKDSWDLYLQVPYLIDVVAVWPKQKIDYSWCDLILGNLNKHVLLEEGFAWLSTLGGAHSSLGETFLHHAKRAGEISGHQLRLALQLGNESLIAKCYVFWSWSLLQRGNFKQCKKCVLHVWGFCKSLKAQDRVLENMCQAVWSRLRYRWALSKGKAVNSNSKGCSMNSTFELRDDSSSDSGDECERGKKLLARRVAGCGRVRSRCGTQRQLSQFSRGHDASQVVRVY